MIRVLFVCAGNICRSPMADAVFQDHIRRAGLQDQISVDSAGVGAWHPGESAHPGTLAVLREHDIAYDGRARQIRYDDFNHFDYVLAMDRENLAGILRLVNRGERSSQEKMDRLYNGAHRPEIGMFLSYANRAGSVAEIEVPDPYYDGRYPLVYELVEEGCTALLAHIRQVHRL